MKLVMTLLARNEDDILAANIEFHLANGVDFIVAMDNLSTDGTAGILQEYARKGVLHYIHQPDDTRAQAVWVTTMARLADTRFGADWVINNDADEFWWPEKGDLKSILSTIEPGVLAATAGRVNFVPRSFHRDGFFADRMTIRERHSLNNGGSAPLPGKVCHRALANVEVGHGNHDAMRRSGFFRKTRSLRAVDIPVTILHFPLRSYEQFAAKIALGGAARERNSRLPRNTSLGLQRRYEMWKRGALEAHYREAVHNDQMIAMGLKDGSLIFDDRLKVFFENRKS